MELLRNEAITIGTDPVEISQEKELNTGKRVDLTIVNTSIGGQNISLAVDSQAVSLSGLVLYPGGFKEFVVTGSVYPTQKQVTAISSVAGGTIALFERVI